MLKAKLLLLSIMILGFFNQLQAQNATIQGTVNFEDGPMEYANVILKGTQIGAITDAEGRFYLEDIPPGEYTLLVSLLGYLSFSQDITLAEGQNLEKNITLRRDEFNMESVVISGTRYEQDRVNNPIVVNVVDNKIFNATQSISVSEGLNYQPGVRVEANCQNCGFTQVRLNGLDGAYSQILINSRAIFSALNSVYGLEQIPTNIVERVEVVRSGGSALYGSNAIGGTINIITKDPVENLWELQSNTAVIDGDAIDQTFSMNGSIVNESLTSGVTLYGMSRNRDSYDANGDGFTELVKLKNTVFGGKAFFKPTDRSKISLDFSALEEYRRGGDRLDLVPYFTDIAEELDHNTLMGGINYEQRTKNDRGQFAVYASAQRTQRDSFYGGLGGGRTPADSLLALNAYGLTSDLSFVIGTQYNHSFNNQDVLTVGIENQTYDTEDEIKGYSRLIDQRVNSTGIFSQYEWKPTEKLTALLGGRYDFTGVDGIYRLGEINNTINSNFGVFSPRFTLLYKINEDLRFRGGYARGFRAPQAFNEDLHISSVGGEPLFVVLSEDLEKETSNAYTGSFNYTKNLGLTQINLLLEGFYTQLQNPFTQVSTGTTLPNGSIVEEVRNGEGATVSGMNIEAGFSPSSSFAFQIGGTLQQSRYDEPQVLFEPETGSENVVVIDEFVRNPNVYGYFTSFYTFSKAFRLDLTGTYTGSMIVPRVVGEDGFVELIDTNPFFDVNLKATYHIDLSDDFQMELAGGLRNMFNSYQPEFDSGPERDSDFVYGPLAPRSVFFSVKFGRLH
ncbi:TonB-dependent receptor [Algoriphagus sediminis]|uniref:TonB-dependent receptor n=1 Tax=Algoriphagus sediminis TaxID=3057113 RepID=A0ABT7Y916_9BACT|nr:TonB-dependent receptor [Algoriphagus sediminis]MDN3202999.1 TonB-dependent receptor [Algoriphagus sediminis]